MTLSDIEQLDREWLTAAEVAKVTGMNPDTIRLTARENPSALGYRVITAKQQVRIPRLAFLKFMRGE